MKVLTVRITEELHRAFKIKCVTEGVEMNTVVTKLIEGYVKGSKPKSKRKIRIKNLLSEEQQVKLRELIDREHKRHELERRLRESQTRQHLLEQSRHRAPGP